MAIPKANEIKKLEQNYWVQVPFVILKNNYNDYLYQSNDEKLNGIWWRFDKNDNWVIQKID